METHEELVEMRRSDIGYSKRSELISIINGKGYLPYTKLKVLKYAWDYKEIQGIDEVFANNVRWIHCKSSRVESLRFYSKSYEGLYVPIMYANLVQGGQK